MVLMFGGGAIIAGDCSCGGMRLSIIEDIKSKIVSLKFVYEKGLRQ